MTDPIITAPPSLILAAIVLAESATLGGGVEPSEHARDDTPSRAGGL